MISKVKKFFNSTKAKTIAGVTALAGALNATAASLGLNARCAISANSTVNKFMSTLFNVLLFAGIVLFALGVVTTIRTVISISGGEQAQPGAIAKGVGMAIGGIVLAAAKPIVSAMIGTDPTSLSIF